MTAPTVGARYGYSARPGLRTFHSRPFRELVALMLLVCGLGILGSAMARQAWDPHGQFGFDFYAYQLATRDLAAGGSLYPPSMLAGPVAAMGEFLYKYPPPFGQLIVPLARVELQIANIIWGTLQGIFVFAGVWLAGTFGGASRTRERFLWSGAATLFFMPVFDAIWKGNVSGAQAIHAALMLGPGAVSGMGVATAILQKTTPLAVLPAALASGDRRRAMGLFITLVLAGLVSFAMNPMVWFDFVRIQGNLAVGDWVFDTNLAPASMIAVNLPGLPWLAAAARLATVALGLACVAASVVVARRTGGWPAAALLGSVAALIIPGAAWYHYLCVLLPFPAFAWPRASSRQRWALLGGAATVSFGLAWLPIAVIGASGLVIATLAVLWPRPLPMSQPS